MAEEKYIPIRKYTFPAGECGGEIRITVPLFASREDVVTAIEAMTVIADRWKKAE